MKEKAGTGGVRVATLNLWGRRGEWNERRRVLVEGFRELEPDLVAFQEAVVGDGYDQVTDLLGSGYHVAHQTDREAGRGGDIEDGQGISVASRWPLGEVWEPDLNVTPRTEDFACGTIIVEVFAPERLGYCCSSTICPTGSSPSSTSASFRQWSSGGPSRRLPRVATCT